MPIQINLWALMLGRWMNRSRQSNGLTTVGIGATAWDRHEGDKPRRGQAPPLDVRYISAHMRRDIGLELDRV